MMGLDPVCDRSIALPLRPSPVRYEWPRTIQGGLIVACPHSGRFYPPELLSASLLDQMALRRSEDAFVDLLFQDAPMHGATLLVSEFARAFVDVNRSPGELDPKLILDVDLSESEANSDRVKAGLGVIPRTVGEAMSIYGCRMSLLEAQARLDEVHQPWHQAIENCLQQAIHHNGVAILLDCHSMPNKAAGDPAYDIILGDRFGASCAPIVMSEALVCLREAGLKVARNNPYAGGYSTRRHGQPLAHHHAIQIEINRSLYMVEGAFTKRPAFGFVSETMSKLVARLISVSESLGARNFEKKWPSP